MAPMIQAGEAVGEAGGPNATVAFGDAGAVQDMANKVKNANPDAYAAAQPPMPSSAPPGAQPPSGGAPPQGGPPQQQAPTQQQPRQPMTPEKAQQIFSPPVTIPVGARQGLQIMASHPAAGPHIARLARLANPNG